MYSKKSEFYINSTEQLYLSYAALTLIIYIYIFPVQVYCKYSDHIGSNAAGILLFG